MFLLKLLSEVRASQRWHWMALTVFFIGMLSILLLLWVNQINENLHTEAKIVDAIMDAQIHMAKGHLWLEHALLSKNRTSHENFAAEVDQAIHLIGVVLEGGTAEHKLIGVPLKNHELRILAQGVRPLLEKLKLIGLERYKNIAMTETRPLHGQFDTVFESILSRMRNLEDMLEVNETVNMARSKSLFLIIITIWGTIVIIATAGLWRRDHQKKAAENKLYAANRQLLAQAKELENHRENLAELVDQRTEELRTANVLLREEMAERLRTCEMLQKSEKQIGQLSTRLLSAQEMERKRISMELHDELGQSLNVMKLQLRVVKKGLREDQEPIRTECENLLEYMNQVIEEVRRISLDLSPTVLEDLGLTSALQWLLNNLRKTWAIKITEAVCLVDHLFPKSQWITIYRVIQEALTNIVKHARAKHVSVIIWPRGRKVCFSLKDDGKGFDPAQYLVNKNYEKGFGLTTMDERVRMLGGDFDISSRKGKGTRITFNIPISEGES